MDKDYINIYSKLLLNKIKNNVHDNFIEKDKKREKETDTKMLKVIEGLVTKINAKRKDDLNIGFLVNELENKNFKEALCVYYVALYNDNIKLLNNVLDNNITLSRRDYICLDKNITEKIDEKVYLHLLKKQRNALLHFIYSIRQNDESFTLEEAINKFSNIVNKNPNVFYSKDKKGYYKFITKNSLKYFKEETLVNAKDHQKEIIQDIFGAFAPATEEEILKKCVSLIEDYDYQKYLVFIDDYLKIFDLEEFINLTDEQISKMNEIFMKKIRNNSKKADKEIEKMKKKTIKEYALKKGYSRRIF